jgi:hypothetical protein
MRFFARADFGDATDKSVQPVSGTAGKSVVSIPDDGGPPSVSVKILDRAAVAGVNPAVGFPRSRLTVATPEDSVFRRAGGLIGMSPVFPAETDGEAATADSVTGLRRAGVPAVGGDNMATATQAGGAKLAGEIKASGIGVKSHLACGIGPAWAGRLPAMSALVLPASSFSWDGASKVAGWPDFALAGW